MIRFSFAVMSDIQYADCDDSKNFDQTRTRFYRDSKTKVQQAVSHWNGIENKPSFLLQLGDFIDGKCKSLNQRDQAIKDILGVLNDFPGQVHHVIGNHDLYNFQRDQLAKSPLNSGLKYGYIDRSQPYQAHYAFYPDEMSCIIILDTYEVGVLGYDPQSTQFKQGEAILRSKNKESDWNSGVTLDGLDRRFRGFNGSVGLEQLQWLDETLTKAEKEHRWTIVCGHQPIHVDATTPMCLCWNYEDIRGILHKHRNVIAYLAGHDHDGDYFLDENGIHHITFPGVIEAQPGTNDFATCFVSDKFIKVQGNGRVPSIVIETEKYM